MRIILQRDNVGKTQQMGVIIGGKFALHFTARDNPYIMYVITFGKRREM